ncbi:MAG: PfkB family carbohydrate kinase [Mediterraneibacter gnavus]
MVPVKVVNTVGAGDSYIAGFTYGIMNGWETPNVRNLEQR